MRIYTIQGTGQRSAFEGEAVRTEGIVTAVAANGFYLQDPVGDGDERTSDALFVFTDTPPTARVGDAVDVSGTVTEYVPPKRKRHRPTTQLRGDIEVRIASHDNPLPAAVKIGQGGRQIPADDLPGAIDVFESLEDMRVEIQNAVAVMPSSDNGSTSVLADGGTAYAAKQRSGNGGLIYRPGHQNPSRVSVKIDRDILPGFEPYADVGDALGSVVGVMSYQRARYKLLPTEPFQISKGTAQPQTTRLVGTDHQLTIAGYNVENLDPEIEDVDVVGDRDVDDDIGSGKFAAIGRHIAQNLKAPDIVGLQEIQDDDGATRSDVVSAKKTLETLVAAIEAAGGPHYDFVDVPPDNRGDGGQPGGNIRNVFLYRADRVELVPDSVERLGEGLEEFKGTRKSVAGRFRFNGEEVTVVNNHLSSPMGSSPLFGTGPSKVKGRIRRQKQAAVLNAWVKDRLAKSTGANVLLLGDFNATEHTEALGILAGDRLTNMTSSVPADQRYSINYKGNSQAFDHLFVTNELAARTEFEPVHVNADFHAKNSDHDPVVARLSFPVAAA